MIGPANWKVNYPFCNDEQPGSRQTPVNIDTSTVKYNSSLKAVTYSNYDVEVADVNFELKNKGYTVTVTPIFRDGETIFPKVSYQREYIFSLFLQETCTRGK